jgi:exonuclease VII small subunit
MTTSEPDRGMTPVTELSYTEASSELDAIVGFFEQREVDVDQLVVRLERATAIVDELDRRVRKTRVQVEELVPRLEAVNRGLDDDTEEDDEEGADDHDVPDDEVDDGDEAETIGHSIGSADDEGDEQALF